VTTKKRGPLVVPLDGLAPGEAAIVVRLDAASPRELRRLTALGLLPGATLEMVACSPALVLYAGNALLALDREAGRSVRVRRITRSSPSRRS